MKKIIIPLIPALIFIVLDSLWFSLFMSEFASRELNPILNIINGQMEARMTWAIAAYLLMVAAAVFFLYPLITKKQSILQNLFHGFLLGVCIFGVFDCTNGALMKVYPTSFILIDTLWGGFLYTLVAAAYLNLKNSKSLT